MSAANQTWTIDATGQKYIDKDGIEHVITANGAFKLAFTDDGVGGRFIGDAAQAAVGCTDGFKFILNQDPRHTFISSVDGSATLMNGDISFIEEGNVMHTFRVISLNMSNADGVGTDNVTSITLESKRHGGIMTWSTIDTA